MAWYRTKQGVFHKPTLQWVATGRVLCGKKLENYCYTIRDWEVLIPDLKLCAKCKRLDRGAATPTTDTDYRGH